MIRDKTPPPFLAEASANLPKLGRMLSNRSDLEGLEISYRQNGNSGQRLLLGEQ